MEDKERIELNIEKPTTATATNSKTQNKEEREAKKGKKGQLGGRGEEELPGAWCPASKGLSFERLSPGGCIGVAILLGNRQLRPGYLSDSTTEN